MSAIGCRPSAEALLADGLLPMAVSAIRHPLDQPSVPPRLRAAAPDHILDIVYQIESMLGELEQIVLLAVLRVGDTAYGVPVHDEIVRLTERDLTLGTVYKTLSRLEDKGYVRSYEGDPTPQRGGRRTRCFAVTITGRRALESSLAVLRRMVVGLDVGLEPT